MALPHQLAILVNRYNDSYRKVFGTHYWAGKKLLRGESNERLEKEFNGILEFFKSRRVGVDERLSPWKDYIEFALTCFKEKGIIPRPSAIKSQGMLKAYCIRRGASNVEHDDVPDYSKILARQFRGPEYLQFLGLSDDTREHVR